MLMITQFEISSANYPNSSIIDGILFAMKFFSFSLEGFFNFHTWVTKIDRPTIEIIMILDTWAILDTWVEIKKNQA